MSAEVANIGLFPVGQTATGYLAASNYEWVQIVHVMSKKGPMGTTGWLLLIFILALFAWISRRQLTNAASGHLPPSDDNATGEWVGVLDITGGYNKYIGDAPGDHNKAAIRFKLVMYDGFLERYAGDGEITIQGETSPRHVHITDLWPDKTGRISVKMVGDWGATDSGNNAHTHLLTGSFKPNALTLIQDYSDWLQFRGTLHRGTDAEYQTLCRSLHGDA